MMPSMTPFANLNPTPFGHTGYHAAFGTPPPWTGTEAASSTTPPAMPPEHKELLAAVRSAFPDQTKMPIAIREAVEKTTTQSSKQLTTDLHRAAAAIGKARRAIQEIQEAKLKHRTMWASHFQEALTAWQQQIQAFNNQQTEYGHKLCKAQADLQTANDWLQELNIQAKAMDMKPLEDAAEVGEITEPTELQPEHIHEQLRRKLEECVQLTGTPSKPKGVLEQVDLTKDTPKEEQTEQERKRARSVESVPAPADSAMHSAS